MDVYKEWLGIPEGPRPPEQYTLLRLVQFEDDVDKIRNNYRKLNAHIRKYSTGQYSVRSQELLNELAKAMLCLTDPERKREYDESQGREFPEDESGTVPLERILVKQGHIERDQMKEAQEFAELRGLSMRDAVVQMKLVNQEVATQALGQELGLPYVDLEDMIPSWTVLRKTPKKVCKRNSILPLFIDDDVLLVACADDPAPDLEEELRLRYGVPMRRVLATPGGITDGIEKYFAEMEEALAAMDESPEAATEPQSKSSGKEKTSGKEKKKANPKKKKAAADSSGKRFSQLSADEQAKRKQVGMILMMWGFIGPVLIDEFFVKSTFPSLNFVSGLPSVTTLIVAPIVLFFVTQVYWK